MRKRLVSLTLVGVLSGCTPAAPKSAPPSPRSSDARASSSSASPTPSAFPTTGPNVRPGEKPPEFPALASRHDLNGIVAVGRYFVLSWDWAIATNDPVPIARLSLPGCNTCRRVVTNLENMRREGKTVYGARIKIESFGYATGHFKYVADGVASVTIVQDAELVQARHGRPVPESKRQRSTVRVFLNWTTAGWRVVEVALP